MTSIHKEQEQFHLRRLQTIPSKHGCVINIAADLVKHLKLNPHDIIAESLDGNNRIILQRVRMHPISDDGVV